MANININHFYHLDKYEPVKKVNVGRLVNSLNKLFLNDNQIIHLIFDIANGLLPNDLDLASYPNTPVEIQTVLQKLHTKFPAIDGFESEDAAFDFIRSRYDQLGEENTNFVQNMVNEINSLSNSQTSNNE